MALRSLLRNGIPEPPDHTPTVRELAEQTLNMPLFLPIRLFWNSLLEMRPWWPVLLPLLALSGWRRYRKERRAFLRQQALAALNNDKHA